MESTARFSGPPIHMLTFRSLQILFCSSHGWSLAGRWGRTCEREPSAPALRMLRGTTPAAPWEGPRPIKRQQPPREPLSLGSRCQQATSVCWLACTKSNSLNSTPSGRRGALESHRCSPTRTRSRLHGDLCVCS